MVSLSLLLPVLLSSNSPAQSAPPPLILPFLFSGDSGVNGRTDEGCSEQHFNPDFPAASPCTSLSSSLLPPSPSFPHSSSPLPLDVTSVGATQLYDVDLGLDPRPPICDVRFPPSIFLLLLSVSLFFVSSSPPSFRHFPRAFTWFCAKWGYEDAVSYDFAGFASYPYLPLLPSFLVSFCDDFA